MSEFSRGLYTYRKADGADDATPFLSLKAWQLGNVVAADFGYSRLVADASERIVDEFQDKVMLRVVRRGRVGVQSRGMATTMSPSGLYLLHPQNLLMPEGDGTSIALRIPMAEVGYDPSRHPPILYFAGHDHIAKMVIAAVDTLFETLPKMTQPEAQAAGSMVSGLVRGLLSTSGLQDDAGDIWRDARENAMHRFVLDNLKNPNLGLSLIQKHFGASRATIYRVFAEDGGVSSFVRKERLGAIDRELRSMAYSHGCVRRVAGSYGFVDPSAFAKSYKKLYGITPGDVVGSRAVAQSREDAYRPFNDPTVPSLAEFWTKRRETASAT